MQKNVEPHFYVQRCTVFLGGLESKQKMKPSFGSKHAVCTRLLLTDQLVYCVGGLVTSGCNGLTTSVLSRGPLV
jgi:hypothetical protein